MISCGLIECGRVSVVVVVVVVVVLEQQDAFGTRGSQSNTNLFAQRCWDTSTTSTSTSISVTQPSKMGLAVTSSSSTITVLDHVRNV